MISVELFLCLFALFGFSSSEIEDGISVIIGSGKSDCFYRDLKQGNRMDLEVQVSFNTFNFIILI